MVADCLLAVLLNKGGRAIHCDWWTFNWFLIMCCVRCRLSFVFVVIRRLGNAVTRSLCTIIKTTLIYSKFLEKMAEQVEKNLKLVKKFVKRGL